MTFHKQASQAAISNTTLPSMGTPEESIPRAVVPWNRDDDRSRYLGLRCTGFTIREALQLIGKAKSTLSAWRNDPVFLDLENRLPELRKDLGLEYASLEFLRNYRLVLEKDRRVLQSSLNRPKMVNKDGDTIDQDAPMDNQDFQYLLRLRSHYTPQQLQAIEQLFGRGSGDGTPVSFTDFVLTLSRTKEELKVETRHRQEPQLGTIDGAFREVN